MDCSLLRPLAACILFAFSPSAGAAPLSVLTYNVAGLPDGISSSDPVVHMPQISPLLNGYDLVLAQEDFAFHTELAADAAHPHQSASFPNDFFNGDGLNRFSQSAFTGHDRVQWDQCFGLGDFGSDCLTTKGFSFARHEVVPGGFVDVYNWHADAGGDPGSNAARQDNLRQLGAYILANSAGNAVIVGGDSNSRYHDTEDIVPELLDSAGLLDVWVELVRGGDRPGTGSRIDSGCATSLSDPECESIDKIFYRSSSTVQLTPLSYEVLTAPFIDSTDGGPLSDHEPTAVTFDVQLVPEPGAAMLLGLAFLAAGCRRRG
ncbi:MAG: endonuclease [Myxococcales bacterium]|nr:endonuclease [Myxococcales bacterium]